MQTSAKLLGLLQALGVMLYCAGVGVVFWKGELIFGDAPNYLGPVAGLLLLCVSALICALLVFYKPYKQFIANKREAALQTVVFTAIWLFALLAILIFAAILF